jgi:hypothetical protein
MRRVFVRDSRKLGDLAQAVQVAALVDFKLTLRDGLNLGGGEYYSFEQGPTIVLLVLNDRDHADVFAPQHADCRFSLFVYRGDGSILAAVNERLNASGIAAYVADEFAGVGSDLTIGSSDHGAAESSMGQGEGR